MVGMLFFKKMYPKMPHTKIKIIQHDLRTYIISFKITFAE